MSPSRQKPVSGSTALHRLFIRQQSKVAATPRKAALLKSFAEEDYKRIAMLIQKWLEDDEKNRCK